MQVTITTEATPTTKALTVTYTVPPTSAYSTDTYDWKTLTGNVAGTKIKITGVTLNGTAGTYDDNVFLDGAKYTRRAATPARRSRSSRTTRPWAPT